MPPSALPPEKKDPQIPSRFAKYLLHKSAHNGK
jgi:hypothetical protein